MPRTRTAAFGGLLGLGLNTCGGSSEPLFGPDTDAGGNGGSGGAAGAAAAGGAPGGAGGSAGAAGGGAPGGGSGGASFTLGPPETLTAGQSFPTRIALDAGHVYWANRGDFSLSVGTVLRMPKAGGEVTQLAAGQAGPGGIAVDAEHVYWANSIDGTLMSRLLAGGAPELMASTLGNPAHLIVDATNVYWTDVGKNSVHRAPKAGGTVATLASPVRSPLWMTLVASTLWVSEGGTDGGNDGTLRAIGLPGGDLRTAATGLHYPQGVAADSSYVYWASSGDGTVVKAPIDGGGSAEVIASGQSQPWGVALDAKNVYFTNRAQRAGGAPDSCDNADGAVVRVGLLAGSKPEKLAADMVCPSAIAVDDSGIYWVVNGDDATLSGGAVMRIPKL